MYKTIESQIEALKTFNQLSEVRQALLLKALKKLKLFTPAVASAKMAKNKQYTQYESYILYMSPDSIAFQALGKRGTLCPFASEGCRAACLNTAGRGRFSSVVQARLRKALYYIVAREAFVAHLWNEVAALFKKTTKRGKTLALRINGTTDIPLHNLTFNGLTIFEAFPNVQFYDYTKNLIMAQKSLSVSNWNVTFSASESNESQIETALAYGLNVAMVFHNKPTSHNGTEVIDGDTHDLRFLDSKRGVIVGLTAKGKAKKDLTGFVRSCNLKLYDGTRAA